MTTATTPYAGPERRISRNPFTGTDRRSRAPRATAPGTAASATPQPAARPMAQGTESRAKFLGHPIHQQLVVFPLGLLATSVVFDLIYLAGRNPTMATVSFWMLVAGIVGGLAASPFGLWDWMEIPEGTRAKAVGMVHGIGNVAVLMLFAASAVARINDAAAPPAFAIVLSVLGGVLAVVTGWMGGELVSRLGIGVSPQAGPNASNSIRNR